MVLVVGTDGEGALDRDVVAMRTTSEVSSRSAELENRTAHRCTLTLTSDLERPGSSMYQTIVFGRTMLEVNRPSDCTAIETRDEATRRAHTSMRGVTFVNEKVWPIEEW